MLWDLGKFEPVYGQAQGQHLDAPLPYALLPFIFSLKAIDATHLRLLTTDFHSNTWQAIRTIEQLEELVRSETEVGSSSYSAELLSHLCKCGHLCVCRKQRWTWPARCMTSSFTFESRFRQEM